jgi:hypothetical protein
MAQHLHSLRGARTEPAVAFPANRSADIFAPDWNTCSDTLPEGVGVFVAGRSSRTVRKRICYLKQRLGRGPIFPQARRWLLTTAGFARLVERAAGPRQRLCFGRQGPFSRQRLGLQSTTCARPLEMKKQERPIERPCRACRGTGLAPAKQPKRPGVRVYPPRCAECFGKGKISDRAIGAFLPRRIEARVQS